MLQNGHHMKLINKIFGNEFKLHQQTTEATVNGESKTITLKEYSKKVRMFGLSVTVAFDPENVKIDLNEYIQQVEKKKKDISKRKNQIEKRISDKLLALKNSTWLEEGENKIDEKKFINKLLLESVQFHEDSFELYFEDGNLFLGHTIIYSEDKNGNLIDVNIAG